MISPALQRIRNFVHKDQKDVLVILYKAYFLPYLEYRSPLLLGVGNAETAKIQTTNYFILRTIYIRLFEVLSYGFLLKMADIKSLEKRRQFQSLVMLYTCLYYKAAPYISEVFNLRTYTIQLTWT